ncbi:MAG: hypothetical protein ACLT0Y_01385 [Christensenellales bacterium]
MWKEVFRKEVEREKLKIGRTEFYAEIKNMGFYRQEEDFSFCKKHFTAWPGVKKSFARIYKTSKGFYNTKINETELMRRANKCRSSKGKQWAKRRYDGKIFYKMCAVRYETNKTGRCLV